MLVVVILVLLVGAIVWSGKTALDLKRATKSRITTVAAEKIATRWNEKFGRIGEFQHLETILGTIAREPTVLGFTAEDLQEIGLYETGTYDEKWFDMFELNGGRLMVREEALIEAEEH